METMPLTLDWPTIAVRLLCAFAAGAAFGVNRSESGKAAGLRTTILVCLAACLAMLQANALLDQTGKGKESFAVLDLMRLPLGILTGMGFIGAGAVLRKDGLVTGVTTAAMLWFITVVGLCFGGGQYTLGACGVVLGLIVLWLLGVAEHRLERRKAAWLTLRYPIGSDCPHKVTAQLAEIGCSVEPRDDCVSDQDGAYESRFLVRWKEAFDVHLMAPSFASLGRASGAIRVQWSMLD
ncbi:MAG TPA: MgtC/SapB family protein [Trinickia sp.]|uniref:MgtC/SapB family protein n=1 Tax=Trinickia sp. TaxID=2571163 RepID=UPI002C5A88B4|nr:MgtC/SapB family protein [Trinickia sp.]HVW53496.1 MgtC/SapB family protein [Trinickia sp.]